MKTPSGRIFALVLIASVLAVTSQAAESLSVLLQKGIFAEETEGNLDAAIKIYEGILKETEANRSLVAQAQYRLGVCQMKRGKRDEAEAAFRKITGQFADQAELALKARERLGEMGKPVLSGVVRQVWSSAEATADSISPDGRYLSFTDWSTGDLAVRDLTTGQSRRLTDKGPWEKSREFAELSVFSPDGKQLAYSWFDGKKQYELRTISLNDSKPRPLLSRPWLRPAAWSPKGETVAVVSWNTNREHVIDLVSTPDGSVRTVESLDFRDPTGMEFSPDGRYVAYSYLRGIVKKVLKNAFSPDAEFTEHITSDHSDEKNPESDVFLLELKSGTERALVVHPADDKLIGWAPDGSGLLVSSDRRGSTDLWFLPVSEGKAAGELTLVKANLGEVSPIAVTPNGAFYYRTSSRSSDVFVASMDFNTGKLLSRPKQVPLRFSSGRKPRPSEDGRYVAFDHGLGPTEKLYVQDLETGQVRDYPAYKFIARTWFGFSPDNQHMLIRGIGHDSKAGIYVLNRTTGELITLSSWDQRASLGPWDINFQDGAIYYVQWDSDHKRLLEVKYDPHSGKKIEREIQPPTNQLESAAVSPDGKQLIYLAREKADSGATRWRMVRRDLSTGKELEVFRSTNHFQYRIGPRVALARKQPFVVVVENPKGGSTVKAIEIVEDSAKERFSIEIPTSERDVVWEWHGAKPHLLFTKTVRNGREATSELWTLSAENGETRKTELITPNHLMLAMNIWVVGENQVFFEKGSLPLSEVWVMENFLPPLAAAK